MRSVPEARSNNYLRCVSYATPAIGNSALKRAVEVSGWDALFVNITLPEDVVPHLLSWTPPGTTHTKTTPLSSKPSTHHHTRQRATTQLMTTTLFSVVLPSLLPQASAAAAMAAPLRAMSWIVNTGGSTGWLGALARMLPLAGAIAVPLVLPANVVWSAGLFACYAGIACLKSTIRLGPQHYHMIGRQFLLTADGVLQQHDRGGGDREGGALTNRGVDGVHEEPMGVWLHGCGGGAAHREVQHSPPSRRPRSWLARVQWQYAMHRMPPLRTRLQAAQSIGSGKHLLGQGDDALGALLCGC